jgi:hypothetical protein
MKREVEGDGVERGLVRALGVGEAGELEEALLRGSGLSGPRMNLGLVWAFAGAVGAVVAQDDPPVEALERLLDGWAARTVEAAPGDQPAVVLPCAAVAAYGEVGVVRPDWWGDEIAKLRRAAGDGRWRVREVVAQAVQRLLAADWARTVGELVDWASDDDPLVVRAAAAAVAEPRLLKSAGPAGSALVVQRRAVERFGAYPPPRRRDDDVRALRQGLGYTVSVVVAATGDVALLREMAASDDRDLRWILRQNLKKSRLAPWADELVGLDDR